MISGEPRTTKNDGGSRWVGRLAFASSVVIFIAAIIFGFSAIGSKQLFATQPAFTGPYLVQTVMMASSALLLVFAITRGRADDENRRSIQPVSDNMAFDLGKLGNLSVPAPVLRWGSLLLSASFLLLFVVSPGNFSALSVEDQLIEMMSALFLFLACGYFLALALQALRHNSPGKFGAVMLALLSVIFFVIGMEEISWFQRFLSFTTPTGFDSNRQNEFNLHNFATVAVEVNYYFYTFVFLILLPFVGERTALLSGFKRLSFFIPSLVVLFVSAPFAAFNFNLWNFPGTQFGFFATFFILAYYACLSLRGQVAQPGGKYYAPALLLIYTIAQVVFIARGAAFIRVWDVTEYKEFLMPLSFVIYTLELVMKMRKKIPLSYALFAIFTGLFLLGLRILPKLRA